MKKSLGAKTLLFPAPVFLVGSYDKDFKPNLVTVAWGGLCCSSPPCVAIALRKATYSHGSISHHKAFTVNVTPEHMTMFADYIGMVSGKVEDKFAVTGLEPVRSELVPAPYIAQSPMILECKVIHIVEIGLHTQFIGEILDVKCEEDYLNGELPDFERIKPISYAPGDSKYFGKGEFLGRAFSIGKELMRK
jgi:flavin reductase (DIM6/NTAB) family NADH-FMN oxidoreductase RutF